MDIPSYNEFREKIIATTYGTGYWGRDYRGEPCFFPPILSITDENKIYDLYDKKYLKKKKACFITLQDFRRREADFPNLVKFCKNIEYIFEEFAWIIESGKSEPLNLHVHILGIINNKNAKRSIKIEYNKIFGDDITEKDFYDCRQWRNSKKMPPYEQWLQEKLDYFINNLKGDHANKIDYTSSGGFGVSGGFLTSLDIRKP